MGWLLIVGRAVAGGGRASVWRRGVCASREFGGPERVGWLLIVGRAVASSDRASMKHQDVE